MAFLAHWSLSMLLALPWAVLHWARLSRRLIATLTLVAAVLLVLFHQAPCLLAAPFIAVAAACLHDIARQVLRERDQVGAVLWLWLLLAFPVTLYIHCPPKYLVPSAPAAALLLVRELYRPGRPGSLLLSAQRRSRLLLASCVAGALVGLLVVHTDANFADLGRRAAAELIAPRVQAGQRVWFAGHWGYQWYAERSGAQPLTSTPPLPQPGDIVVASSRAEGHYIELLPNRVSIAHLADSSFGGRVMAREVGAGFFSNGAGLYPWMVSTRPLDRYDVFLVTPPH
jgi:hypothetical protein